MSGLNTYQGVVEGGKVRLLNATLPDGVQVVVVAPETLPSIEEQLERLRRLSPEEWRKPFDAIRRAWETSEPADQEAETLTDDELNALVHEAREEVRQEKHD
ncbi:MAG TPA: hypothetical protein VJG32_01350 [Anaerolineae bacterium]|nr:hypothetical protein [Anaerolineae bacterium]